VIRLATPTLLRILLVVILSDSQSIAQTRYFLVSEISQPCSQCDSYVLPISDFAAIEHARELVALGPSAGRTIAVAEAAAGADGFNRDLLAPGEPLWTWRVTALIDFGDFAIELCDGSPTLVEADPPGFLANTNGVICFWGYTISAEIDGPAQPAPMGGALAVLLALTLAFAGFELARRRRLAGRYRGEAAAGRR
jgi:hypothetical protein